MKNKLSALVVPLVACFCCLCLSHAAKASIGGAALTPTKLVQQSYEKHVAEIKRRTLIIYAPSQGQDSMLSRDEYQRLLDYQIELFTQIAKNQGIDFKLVIAPLEEVKKAISEGQYAIATSMPMQEFNAEQFSYSLPYIELQISEFQRVNLADTPTVLLSDKEYQRIRNLLNDYIVKRYQTNEERNQILEANIADIIRSPFPSNLRKKLNELGIEDNYTELVDTNNPALIRATVHPKYRELLRAFNAGLRNFPTAELDHLKETFLTAFDGQVKDRISKLAPGMSEEEQDFILDNVFIDYIAEPHHSAPFIFVQDTRITGYWVELLNEISLRTGLVFKPYLVDNLAEGFSLLEDSKSKVFTGIVNPDFNSTTLAYSIPYDTYSQQIISRNSAPLKSLSQLKGHRVAAVRGFRIGNLVEKRFPQINIVEYNSTEEALNAVTEGKVVAAVANAFAATYQAQAMGHTNLHFSAISSLKNEKFTVHMATPKNSLVLRSLLNKGLKLTDPKTISELKQHWNNFSFDTSYIERSYHLRLLFIGAVFLVVLALAWAGYRYNRRKMAREQKHHEYTRIMLEQVEQAKQQVMKANKTQSYFFARMTHEIRTPLNGLFGMAEALAMSDLNEQQRQNLTILQQSGKNLVAILDDILDLSKMDSGKLSLKYKPCDIEQQVNSCLAAFGERAKTKGIKLRLEMHSKLNSAYQLDPLRFTQILNNLISNAIKFTDQGQVLVKIRLLDADQGIEFVVSDTGVGIPADKIESIFHAYHQADDEVQRVYGGTGLGLSICRELVSKMGGQIWAESEQGHGTKFYFQLPLKATSQKPHEFIDKNTRVERSLPTYPKLRMLLAEDNLVNQKVLTEQLKLFKIYPDIANNGAEAWEMFLANDYDVVLSDCHMPEMDGFELARKISETPGKAPWLIAITADALNGADNVCFDAGFNDYLKKPLNRFQLAAALSKAVDLPKNRHTEKSANDHSGQNDSCEENFTIINAEMVSELCAGDNDTIASMLSNFLDTVSEYDKIVQLVKTDHKALNETVQKLKGSSQYFGASHLVQLCRKLVNDDLTTVQKSNYAGQIKAQLALMTQEARIWLKQLKQAA